MEAVGGDHREGDLIAITLFPHRLREATSRYVVALKGSYYIAASQRHAADKPLHVSPLTANAMRYRAHNGTLKTAAVKFRASRAEPIDVSRRADSSSGRLVHL
jgi:hypothetical protein